MRYITGILLFATICMSLSCGSTKGTSSAHYSGEKLKKVAVTIGAQSNVDVGSVLSFKTGKVMTATMAALRPENVDVIYGYGRTTHINLFTPKSNRMKAYGSFKKTIANSWSVFNRGYLVNIRHGKEARHLYKKTKTKEQLKGAYDEAKRMAKRFLDYKKLVNGPTLSIRKVEPGDIFVFKSTAKDFYVIGRVVGVNKGYSGTLTLNYKVAKD